MEENYIYYVFGKNLKKYRKLKGLTQEQLAEKSLYVTGISPFGLPNKSL